MVVCGYSTHVMAAATRTDPRCAGDQRNSEYVQMILDQKAQAAARAKEKQKLLTKTRDRTRDDQARASA